MGFKKEVFLWILAVVIVFLIADVLIYNNQYKTLQKKITGFLIETNFSSDISRNLNLYEVYTTMPIFSRIIFMLQWIVLVLVLFFVFLIKRKKDTVIEEPINPIYINLKENSDKKKTDLDILYEILKKRKSLKISTISQTFNVDKEIALEWCRILESGNLARIDYPGFGEPVIKILEDGEKDEKDE